MAYEILATRIIGNIKYEVEFDQDDYNLIMDREIDLDDLSEEDRLYIKEFRKEGFGSFFIRELKKCDCCTAFSQETDSVGGVHAICPESALDIYLQH